MLWKCLPDIYESVKTFIIRLFMQYRLKETTDINIRMSAKEID